MHAIFSLGLRKVRVAAVLCNVVAFEQDVQEGVSDYAASEAAMMTGERLAIAAALHALGELGDASDLALLRAAATGPDLLRPAVTAAARALERRTTR